MNQQAPPQSPLQTAVMVACVAIGIVGMMVLQSILGYSGLMASTMFGAIGGGVGGLLGAVLASVVGPKQ